MTTEKVKISIWSNNEELFSFLVHSKLDDLVFEDFDKNKNNDYLCVFVDFYKNTANITEKLLKIYLYARENNKKIVIVLLPKINGSSEEIKHFQKLLDDISKEDPIHRLIICQDLYVLNNDILLTNLDTYLTEIINKLEITTSQKGNFQFYPVSLLDLLSVIKKSLFLTNTNGKEFYLEGDPISDIELAFVMKSLIQEYHQSVLDINTTKNSDQEKISYAESSTKTSALLNLNQKSNFEQDLKNFIVQEKIDNKQKVATKEGNQLIIKIQKIFSSSQNQAQTFKKRLLKKTTYYLERILALIVIFYILSSAFFMISSYYSLKTIERTLFLLRKGDLVQSSSELTKSRLWSSISATNYKVISPILIIISSNFDKTNQNFLSFIDFTQSSIEGLQQTYSLVETAYKSLNNTQTNQNYENLALALKSNLQQSYESLNQVEILLNQEQLPKPLLQKIKQAIEYKELKAYRGQLGEAIKVVDIIPEIFGSQGVKNTFVLIQNDNEQRSTGGVIEFIYQISIDRGQVVFQKSYLSQDVDKINDFVVVPPPLVEKITGEINWKLRDMNYNPDFPQTATNISWYLEKKLKTKPNLVISLNTKVLENILINNPELSKELSDTKSDVYSAKLQSGEAIEVTNDLFQKIIAKIINHQVNLVDLASISTKAISDGNLKIWVENNEIENILKSEPVAGSITNYPCISAMNSARKCFSETTSLNFSNFSLIPLNNYLQKSFIHTVTPEVLSVDNEIIVNYKYLKNTPLINRNLVEIAQLYLPSPAIISKITLNNEDIPLQNLISTDEFSLKRYQFILSTTLNQNQQLKIKYVVPLLERTILPHAYSITDIKQNNNGSTNYKLEINIPEQTRASAVSGDFLSQPNKLIYEDNNLISSFGVNFVPK